MSRPENAELLAGIVESPDDDDRRLVYADWLEENGDPERAGFIRAQVLLAACSPADEAYPDLLERQREATAVLWSRVPAKPEVPQAVLFRSNWYEEHDDSAARYQRGFPFFVDEPFEREPFARRHVEPFRDALQQLVKATTIRGLRFTDCGSRFLSEILATPAAAHFTALAAHKNPTGATTGVVAAISASPLAESLRWLELKGTLEADELATLASAGVLGRLTHLDATLEGDRRGLRRLPEWFGQLRWYRGLVSNRRPVAGAGRHPSYGRDEVGIERLAKLPHLTTLKTAVDFGGAANLAGAKGFASLGALSLRGDLRGQCETLAKANLPRLAALDLHGCHLRSEDFAALCGSDLFANLRVLTLRAGAVQSASIGDRAVAALAKSPCASRLRILSLENVRIGKQAFAALAKPSAFPRLTTLCLLSDEQCKASEPDVTRFLTSLSLPSLRHLTFHGWPVADAGARALAANPAFGNLTMLDLRNCRVGAEGAAALFNSPHLRRLVKLDLSYNPSGAAIEALLDPALLPDLCECGGPGWHDARLRGRLQAVRKTCFIG